MYIAMNRFRVPAERAGDFEALWLNRESTLDRFDGFVAFHMLKGPTQDGVTLYASHTTWASEEAFRAWLKAQDFKSGHGGSGANRDLYLAPPDFEGFTPLQTITAG
ncbi:MAG: antibiotic biosynthesis monooxygenase [Paracoccaceae bacterium]|nr:antibiotic biosynthesis monooxygenase [Paracoccaceae bacterium]